MEDKEFDYSPVPTKRQKKMMKHRKFVEHTLTQRRKLYGETGT